MAYNVFAESVSSGVVSDLSTWVAQYKERNISASHDQSMLSLATPDDAIIIAGPPRLAGQDNGGDLDKFYTVGFVNMFQYSEQSQVQPLKALGSRRHIFSRTNTPVNGSIGKMLCFGPNLIRALYSQIEADQVKGTSSKFMSADVAANALWYSNLEEDLYRVPFGLGVIYSSPGTSLKGVKKLGAEYFESVVLINRSVSLQSGQTMIMENVSFMADRVVPLSSYIEDGVYSEANLLGKL